jgi:hypothetical protein
LCFRIEFENPAKIVIKAKPASVVLPITRSHDGSPDGIPDGSQDGIPDGNQDGIPDGSPDGIPDGSQDGIPDGSQDGIPDGNQDGIPDGNPDGSLDGIPDGIPDGSPDGSPDGIPDGIPDGSPDGIPDGSLDGSPDGSLDGIFNLTRFKVKRNCPGEPLTKWGPAPNDAPGRIKPGYFIRLPHAAFSLRPVCRIRAKPDARPFLDKLRESGNLRFG